MPDATPQASASVHSIRRSAGFSGGRLLPGHTALSRLRTAMAAAAPVARLRAFQLNDSMFRPYPVGGTTKRSVRRRRPAGPRPSGPAPATGSPS